MHYYLGGPFWSFADWKGVFYTKKAKNEEFLEQYSSVFNTVEAGSTFYANPKPAAVAKWRQQVPDTFRFVFKLPGLITHKLMLLNCERELSEFLKLMEPVHDVTGMFHIQLAPTFKPVNLPLLKQFLDGFPSYLPRAVEVRHRDWFDAGENEKQLEELLLAKGVTRIHFNTEGLFSKEPDTASLKESWSKKPRNPDRWTVTTPNPAIRFISCDHLEESLKDSSRLVQAASYWLKKGLTPYIFLHSPGNKITPDLCREFHRLLQKRVTLPDLPQFPADQHIQPELF